MTNRSNEKGRGDFSDAPEPRQGEQPGARVPKPDPKDQTGDPEADNPAMQELRRRQSQGNITER